MGPLRLIVSAVFTVSMWTLVQGSKGVWVPRTRSRGHYRRVADQSKSQCRDLCLADPYCAVVTFFFNTCHMHYQVTEEPNQASVGWFTFIKTSSKLMKDDVCFGVHTRGHWLRYRKLTGNDYKKIQTKCPMACGVACDKDPKCVGASVPIEDYPRTETCTLHSNLTTGRFQKLRNMQSAFYVKIDVSSSNEGVWFPDMAVKSASQVKHMTSERKCAAECLKDASCAVASIVKDSQSQAGIDGETSYEKLVRRLYQNRSASDKARVENYLRFVKNTCLKSRNIRSKTNYDKNYSALLPSWKTFIKTKSTNRCAVTKNRGYWYRMLKLSTNNIKRVVANCYDECASQCEKTKFCVAATYHAQMKRCDLKDRYDGAKVSAMKGFDVYIKLNFDEGHSTEPNQPDPGPKAPTVSHKFCQVKAAHPYHCPELWLSTEYRIHSQQDCQDICNGRGSCQAYFNDNEKHGKWDNHCLLMVGLCMKKEAGEEPVEYFSKSQTQEC